MTKQFFKYRKNPLVFIGTPTSDVKNYCWDEFYSRVNALSYKKRKFAIIDNSKSRKNLKNLRKIGIECDYVNPKQKDAIKFICESHNALRRIFLSTKAEYFLHLESDVIPPQDVIERLLLHEKAVVSAPYFINVGDKSHLMIIEKEADTIGSLETTRMDNFADFKIMDGQLHKVHSAGLGCTLIHRDIMKDIKFRYEEGFNAHPDTFFAIDLDAKGIPFYVDTGILCEHRNSPFAHIVG